MRPYHAVIYGAYGYTGQLITEECRRKNLNILLSGRDATQLRRLSEATDFAYEPCDLNAPSALATLLGKGQIVIHCAGPFHATARQMIDACLEARTHYLDITGEYIVFEMLAGYDAKARIKGILVMPGVGFDVVPSDCLALHLKNRAAAATHLQLGFTMSKGGVSRGTARTMIDGLGHGSMIRRNGNLTPIRLGEKVLNIDFGEFQRKGLCIPWGDISTAWRSTGIPNIEVYSAVPETTIHLARVSSHLNWLMRKPWLKAFLRKRVDARPPGPDEDRLYNGRSYLWGRAHDGKGNVAEARLKTLSGYLLTAKTAVLIAEKLINNDVRTGYHTPAGYFGEGLIFEVEGSEWLK